MQPRAPTSDVAGWRNWLETIASSILRGNAEESKLVFLVLKEKTRIFNRGRKKPQLTILNTRNQKKNMKQSHRNERRLKIRIDRAMTVERSIKAFFCFFYHIETCIVPDSVEYNYNVNLSSVVFSPQYLLGRIGWHLHLFKSVLIFYIYHKKINLEGSWSFAFQMGPLLWKMMLVWFDLLKSFTKTYKYNTLTKWVLLWDTTKTQTSVMIRITYIIRRSWPHRSTAKLYQLKIVLELLAWTCLLVIITEENQTEFVEPFNRL